MAAGCQGAYHCTGGDDDGAAVVGRQLRHVRVRSARGAMDEVLRQQARVGGRRRRLWVRLDEQCAVVCVTAAQVYRYSSQLLRGGAARGSCGAARVEGARGGVEVDARDGWELDESQRESSVVTEPLKRVTLCVPDRLKQVETTRFS